MFRNYYEFNKRKYTYATEYAVNFKSDFPNNM